MEIRNIKIGRITCGILLILAGIAIFANIINPSLSLEIVIAFWPLILISLGLETLYYNFKKNVETKFDFWCMLILISVTGFCLIFYTANIYINKILTNDIKTAFIENRKVNTYVWELENEEVIIENLSNIADIEIIETKYIEQPKIVMEVKYKNIFDRRNDATFLKIKNGLTILDNDRNVESIVAVIYTPDKEIVSIIK